jgi:hypothetical protein
VGVVSYSRTIPAFRYKDSSEVFIDTVGLVLAWKGRCQDSPSPNQDSNPRPHGYEAHTFDFSLYTSCRYEACRSRSYFTTDGRSVSQYVLVSSTLVGLATRYYFLSECFSLKFAVLFMWAPSLTRGRACNLQFKHSMVQVAQKL